MKNFKHYGTILDLKYIPKTKLEDDYNTTYTLFAKTGEKYRVYDYFMFIIIFYFKIIRKIAMEDMFVDKRGKDGLFLRPEEVHSRSSLYKYQKIEVNENNENFKLPHIIIENAIYNERYYFDTDEIALKVFNKILAYVNSKPGEIVDIEYIEEFIKDNGGR